MGNGDKELAFLSPLPTPHSLFAFWRYPSRPRILGSSAARVSAMSRYLPVPMMSRELKLNEPIWSGSACDMKPSRYRALPRAATPSVFPCLPTAKLPCPAFRHPHEARNAVIPGAISLERAP